MKSTIALIDGFEKRDAIKPLGLRLLPQDGKRAVMGDPSKCTMSRGIRRATGADVVLVFRSSAYVVMDKIAWRYAVPRDVVRDVIDPLDRGEEPVSGFYTLNVPTPSQRLGAASIRRDNENKGDGEPRKYKQRKGQVADPRRFFKS